MFKFLSLCHIVTLLMEIPACSSLSLPYLLLYIPDSQTFSLCTLILTRWWIFFRSSPLVFLRPCGSRSSLVQPSSAMPWPGKSILKFWQREEVIPAWCPHRQTLDFDTSGLADDKYAIAESILEAERKKLPRLDANKACGIREGAWTIDAAGRGSRVGCRGRDTWRIFVNAPLTFVRGMLSGLMTTRHGSINAEKFCVSAGTLGKPKVSSRITRWSLSFLLMSKGIHDLKCGDEAYLFAKVAFSPFDATLVKLKLERLGLGGHDSPSPWVARMHPTNEGLPDMMSLDLFLKQCCESFDGESDKLQILHYSGGRKFGELDIQSMEAIEQALRRAAPEVVARDADLEEEQRAAKKRSDLLRKVLMLGQTRTPSTRRPSQKQEPCQDPRQWKNQQSKPIQKVASRRQDPDDSEDHPAEEDEDPDEPGFSGAMHRTIEREWAGALEGDLPQASSSSSSSSSHGPGHPPVQDQPVQGQPIQQPAAGSTLPWKDSSGYCFLPKDGNAKGTHLGAQLSTLNSTRLPWP